MRTYGTGSTFTINRKPGIAQSSQADTQKVTSRRKPIALASTTGAAFEAWSNPGAGSDLVRIGGFGSPLTNSAGRLDLRWEPGVKVPFGVGLDLADPSHPPSNLKVELWTNIRSDDPEAFEGIPMHPTHPIDHHPLAYNVEVPVDRTGTYTAIPRFSTDGGDTWKYGTEYGIPDTVFRAVSKEFEALNMRQILVANANVAPGETWQCSTFEDMMEGKWGNYNLDGLQSQGVNTVYIECPFRADPWDRRHPVDTLGSPFAVTDYFAIDPRLSREAQKIPGWDRDRQREVANESFKRFTSEAHKRGMKVIVGMAPNHVGHNYTFRDLFEKPEGGYQVMRNNFSQIAVNQGQLDAVQHMLNDPNVQGPQREYAEYLFPWMYATRDDRPEGANHAGETMSEWWYGNWDDIKKLNHGGHMALGHTNGNSPQQRKVRDYLARAMAHAAVELGVDGYRIDHANGMAENFLNRSLTKAQRITDRLLGYHKPLFMMPEDHDRKAWTAKRTDLVQSEWWHALESTSRWGDVEGYFGVIQNPYFYEVKAADTHDTGRGVNAFEGDLKSYGRYLITTMFTGGPFTMMMGSEFGEGKRTNFKAHGGVPVLWQARNNQLADANIELNKWVSKAGKLKISHPALRTRHLQRMYPANWSNDTARTVAFAKHPEHEWDNRVLVYSNLANRDHQVGFFNLDDGTRGWVSGRNDRAGGNARFQVKNLLSDNPNDFLWPNPKSAGEILGQGIFVDLNPYQIQALELVQV